MLQEIKLFVGRRRQKSRRTACSLASASESSMRNCRSFPERRIGYDQIESASRSGEKTILNQDRWTARFGGWPDAVKVKVHRAQAATDSTSSMPW